MSYPATIQSITIPKIGGIELLQKSEIPFPKIAPNHIVVKIEYGGVNFVDTYYRQGLYPLGSFPAGIGKEAAGIIVGLPTDQAVLDDENYKKRGYKKGGKVAVDYIGSHAEYVSIPWKTVYPVPDSISTLTAAAGTLQAITAVSFMEESYQVKQGDVILVHTVAGGLGLLFAQLGKALGATIIGTTSSKEKAELAKANGADHVILYPVENVVERVLEITNGEGVHAVYDGVGKDTFEDNFKLIRRKGTIVCVGNASGPPPLFSPLRLVEKNVKLLRPSMVGYTYTPEECLYYGNKVFKLIADGTLKIKVFKEYPFTGEGVQQAQRDLTERGERQWVSLSLRSHR